MAKINDSLYWNIHGHAKNDNGPEHHPHVHITCSDGGEISVSIEKVCILAGKFKSGKKEDEALDWVRANYGMLMNEWKSKEVDN